MLTPKKKRKLEVTKLYGAAPSRLHAHKHEAHAGIGLPRGELINPGRTLHRHSLMCNLIIDTGQDEEC